MKLETVSGDSRTLPGWTPTVAAIESLSEGLEIGSTDELKPCGCGVKLDLQDVVYPALTRVREEVDLAGVAGFSRRVDAHVHRGRMEATRRFLVSKAELRAKSAELAEEIARFGADSVVELFSTSLLYFESRDEIRKEFSEMVEQKARLLAAVAARLRERNGPDRVLHFGKGHSIRAGGDFFLFDVIRHAPAEGYSVMNNDTIITADSLLRHHAPVCVFTALNNALNDLFLMGVTEELVLLPVYDGDAGEAALIREALAAYRDFYAQRGVQIEVRDEGPLGTGAKVVGCTAIGQARHELPGHAGLVPGQVILATRFLGDLSFLSMHRGLHFPLVKPHADLDPLRWEVLQRFATPNLPVARVIRKFLPELGEAFDPARHVTFSSDVSGPGLFVLEEGARASGVDVYVHDLRFIDERSLRYYRKNQTSSTNGPILLSAMPAVAQRLEAELAAAGLREVWRVGHVRGKSNEPTIFLNEELGRRFASADPRTDLFSPEVHFGSGESLHRERTPIFERMRFCPPETC